MKLSNISIRYKLNALIVLSIVFLCTSCIANLFHQRAESIEMKKNKLQSQVETAITLVQYFYDRRHLIGEESAKQEANSALSSLRYDGNHYFWVFDNDLNVIMHPTKQQLIGKNANSFKDGNGKYHWREMLAVGAGPNQGGFLDYKWKSPNGILKDKISYVEGFAEWGWIIGSGIMVSDVHEAFIELAIQEAAISIVLSVLLFTIGFFIIKDLNCSLDYLNNHLKKLTEGDFTARSNLDRKDEFGLMGSNLERMQEKLQSTLSIVKITASESQDIACQIAHSCEFSANNISSQNAQLNLLSTAMAEMTSTITDVANSAEQASEISNKISQQAKNNDLKMSETLERISSVSKSIQQTNVMVENLQIGVNNIESILTVIKDVSEQTSLLALNAAIEAARAGEQGKGFAVVADEVRNLAKRTKHSTDEVQITIDQLKEQANTTFKAMQHCGESIIEGVEYSNMTRAQLTNIVKEIDNSNDLITQIASAAEQQSLVTGEVSSNVTSIHIAASEVLAISNSLATHSQHMTTSSTKVADMLDFFKI